MEVFTCSKHNYSGIDTPCPDCANGIKPPLCDVRNELEKSLLSEDAPTLKQFEKWFAKGHNAAIKKALKIIDAHFA